MTRAYFRIRQRPCLGLLLSIGAGSQAQAAANCIKGDRKPPYTIGWANIYSVPTWMKQTQGTIEAEVEELKKQGLVDKLVVTDAQGDANTQIQQIQSMIDSDVDAIILIAGSSTAPARVVADACAKGIAIINFDSLVDTDQVTAKVNTDSAPVGRQAAKLLIEEIGGKGKILVLNGPAGISVSDDRRKGADAALAANPGIVDPRRDQHRLQRRAGAGGRHQPALRQSRDRRHPVARRRAVGRRDPGHGQAGPRPWCRSPARTPASSSNCGRKRA